MSTTAPTLADLVDEIAAALPADGPVLVTGEGPLAAALTDVLAGRRPTTGRPAAVVETTGAVATIAEAIAAVDDLGTVVLVGPAPDGPVVINLYADLHARSLTLVALLAGISRRRQLVPMSSSPTTVAVCALTLHRPVGLRHLLEALAAMDPPADTEVSLVVVDNDPEGTARPVVDACRAGLPWPTNYVVEPRRGIPFGRNAAIAAAGDVDFVAFIDDDEVPDQRWLAELVAAQRRHLADVVTGPVLPDFDTSPPRWVAEGGFFERTRFADGERLTWATTSSVLIARHLVAAQPVFSEAMALTGGSDTHFFMRARLAGSVMVWADRAQVTETIPASRTTARWLLQREYRRGNTLTLCLLDLQDSPVRRVRRAVHGLLRIAEGMVRATVGLRRGRAGVLRGLQVSWFGLGLLAGLAGRRYEEYRTIHGH